MVLPTNGFKVTGNMLRLVAAGVFVVTLAGGLVADRLRIEARDDQQDVRLMQIDRTIERMNRTDSVLAANEQHLVRRQCLVLAVLGTMAPESGTRDMVRREASRCGADQ